MKSNNMRQPRNKGIYILTNMVNNKQYVGMDSNMPQRFKQHIKGISKCPLLQDALSVFGLDKWTVQFIPYPRISKTALRAVEQWYICKLKTKHPNGYNMRDGSNPNLKQKRKPLKRLTPVAKRRAELKAQVRKCREQGVLLEAIAAEFGISLSKASQWCKDIKIEKETVRSTASKKRAEKAALKQRAIDMEASGMERKKIARELNEKYRNICRWLKKCQILTF